MKKNIDMFKFCYTIKKVYEITLTSTFTMFYKKLIFAFIDKKALLFNIDTLNGYHFSLLKSLGDIEYLFLKEVEK